MQWISVNKTNHDIHRIVIHLVDSVIHILNNPGQRACVLDFRSSYFRLSPSQGHCVVSLSKTLNSHSDSLYID